MNEKWTPPDLYTLDWHEAWCKAYSEGKPMPPRTDDPITGYYRGTLFENGPHVAYSYFYADGVLYCEVDNKVYGALEPLPNGQTPREAWQYVVKNPITGKQFMYYIDKGYWEEDAYLHTNNPPDDVSLNSIAALEADTAALVTEAQRLVSGPPAQTQLECDQADALIAKLYEHFGRFKDNAWIFSKVDNDPDIEPEMPEIKEHFNKYNTAGITLRNALRACEIYEQVKKKHILPFLKKRRGEALARGEDPPKSISKNGVRATTLTVLKKAKITNLGEALDACGGDDGVIKAVQQWADRYVKANKKAPAGCKLVEEEIAS